MIKEITVKQFDNFTDIIDIDFAPGQTTLDVSKWVLFERLGPVWKSI